MTGTSRRRRRTFAAKADRIESGAFMIVEVGGRSVGLIRLGDRIVAVRNICPHAYGPICRGQVTGTTLPGEPGQYEWGREGEILVCPWHGWEFDLNTGRALADATRHLSFLPVEVEGEDVYVAA